LISCPRAVPSPLPRIHISRVRHKARLRKHTRMCASTRSVFDGKPGAGLKSLLLIRKASSAWVSCMYQCQSLAGLSPDRLVRNKIRRPETCWAQAVTFGALSDLQSAGAASRHGMTITSSRRSAAGKNGPASANATFDFAGILAGMALEDGVGFVKLSRSAGVGVRSWRLPSGGARWNGKEWYCIAGPRRDGPPSLTSTPGCTGPIFLVEQLSLELFELAFGVPTMCRRCGWRRKSILSSLNHARSRTRCVWPGRIFVSIIVTMSRRWTTSSVLPAKIS